MRWVGPLNVLNIAHALGVTTPSTGLEGKAASQASIKPEKINNLSSIEK